MLQIEKLYMQYGQDVYRYLLSLTRDPLLSEDLLSETFLAVITSLPSFQGESSVKTWLFSIARHKWLQQLRSNGRKGEGGALSYEQLEDFLADWYLSEDPSKHLTDAEACRQIAPAAGRRRGANPSGSVSADCRALFCRHRPQAGYFRGIGTGH